MVAMWGQIQVSVEPASVDDRIADLLSRRDPAAMELLYDRYSRFAYTLAYRVLNDAGTSEDVVQEAFLAIWRRADSFDRTRGGLRTWMASIVHHRALDRLRGRSGRNRTDLPLDSLPADRSTTSDSWVQVAENLEREEIRSALDTLSAEQRETIELAYFGGLSQTEISTKLSIPLGTVKGRTRLALRRLRTTLAGRGIEWAL